MSSGRLTLADFTKTANISSPETLSPVLSVTVPRGVTWFLPADQTIEMILPAKVAATPDATNEDILAGGAAIGATPNLTDAESILVYDTVGEKYLTVSAVNRGTGAVTVSDATSGQACSLYLPMMQGTVQIAIVAPMGLGNLSIPIFNRSLSAVHSVNQQLSTSRMVLKPGPYQAESGFSGWPVPEGFKLQVLVKSSKAIAVNDALATQAYIDIPYRYMARSATPKGLDQAMLQYMTTQGR
jgi:hypothetical protein